MVLTYNEEPNIRRSLQKLTWAKRIVIVDSHSTDTTIDIVEQYPQAEVFQREFASFADQCNYGLSKISTDWVLSLDADYTLTDELIEELKNLADGPLADGYFARLEYCIFGKPLRGTLLPPRQVLYRRAKAFYENDGHAHRVFVKGTVSSLDSSIYHDDRKPLSRWLWAQDRYMLIEAEKLLKTPDAQLSLSDKLRKRKLIAPFAVLFYCLLLKGGILDGWRGWYYAFQRMFAETLLSLRLIEKGSLKEYPNQLESDYTNYTQPKNL